MEDGSTEVKGGLIMTNVMLLKNAEGDVTAGVSGLQEDDVPFWSGADYTNRKKAVFRVHADGEVHATKGTVGILQVKNDSVEVSDAAASGDKIILTPYRITSISQVLGAVSVPGVIETKEVSALATGQSNPFVRNVYESSPPFTCGQGVQMSARITARITGNAEGGGGGVKIEVVNALTGKANPLYRNSTAEAQNTNLNIDETISYLFTGAAQKYYIRITVEASAAGKLTASATMNAAQFNFVKDIRKNLIAPNGVAVVKGSSNYAVFTGDIFEVLIGIAGLRIQNGSQDKGTIRSGGSVKIEIINQTADTTDTIFRQSSAYDDTVSIQINKNISYRFTTPGNYYIKVTVEASSSGGLGNAASAAVEAITFSFVTDIRKNLIAPNGVAVVKGSSNYAVFTGDIFEVLIGKAGLRIQNGYVYKRDTDHTTWTKI